MPHKCMAREFSRGEHTGVLITQNMTMSSQHAFLSLFLHILSWTCFSPQLFYVISTITTQLVFLVQCV